MHKQITLICRNDRQAAQSRPSNLQSSHVGHPNDRAGSSIIPPSGGSTSRLCPVSTMPAVQNEALSLVQLEAENERLCNQVVELALDIQKLSERRVISLRSA